MGEDALQFRSEENFAVLQRVVQRLDAHPIARKKQLAFGVDPYADAEHTAKPGERILAPAKESFQYDFCVAMTLKYESFGLQFRAKLLVVVDLAVEDDDHVAVGTEHRLIAMSDVANAQANRPERHVFRRKLT